MIDERGDPVRPLLRRAGLSPESLAGCLNRRAEQLGLAARVDRKTPYKWLRGTVPRPPWPALVAAILTERLELRVDPGDLGWPTDRAVRYVPAGSGLDLPWTADGALRAAVEVLEINAMDRRVFVQLTGAALAQPALAWLVAEPAAPVASAAGRRVLHRHVDSIDEIIGNLRRMDDQFGGGTVLDVVVSNIRFVVDLLRKHSYDTQVGTRLQGAAAELLRLGGWLSFDSGQHTRAQRFWVAALRTAHAAGDRALGANVLGFMSCQAKDLERHEEAARLAEAARRGYPGASPRVAAILAMRVAEARAQLGDELAVRAAVDEATEAVRTGATGQPGWSYWIDEAQVHAMAGYSYTRLGDWSRAQSHLQAAIRLQRDGYSREAALRQALLAGTYARQGDPEQACAIGYRAVDILEVEVDSRRCVGHIRRLQETLSPYRRNSAVRDFDDRANQVFGVAA